jgi:hypothetical protein
MRSSQCLTAWDGRWVQTDLRTLPYVQDAAAAGTNPQSRYIAEDGVCRGQRSWSWTWASSSAACPFEVPSRAQLCSRLASKSVLLYGDSLTQQFLVSIASLAGNASAWTATATTGRAPKGCWSRKMACFRVCDGSATVCHRAKFGLVVDEPPRPPHNCSVRATVQPLAQSFAPACIARFDVVILSEWAHWAGVDGALGLQQCLEEAGTSPARAARWSQGWIAQRYAEQMERNAAFLRAVVTEHAPRTRVLFRTSAPGYPPPQVLPPDVPGRGDDARAFTAPTRELGWAHAWASALNGSETFNHHMVFGLNAAARSAYASRGLGVMDLERPMLHRVDGHLDRLHYCLPGPPDFYTHALYNYVL